MTNDGVQKRALAQHCILAAALQQPCCSLAAALQPCISIASLQLHCSLAQGLELPETHFPALRINYVSKRPAVTQSYLRFQCLLRDIGVWTDSTATIMI